MWRRVGFAGRQRTLTAMTLTRTWKADSDRKVAGWLWPWVPLSRDSPARLNVGVNIFYSGLTRSSEHSDLEPHQPEQSSAATRHAPDLFTARLALNPPLMILSEKLAISLASSTGWLGSPSIVTSSLISLSAATRHARTWFESLTTLPYSESEHHYPMICDPGHRDWPQGPIVLNNGCLKLHPLAKLEFSSQDA